MKLEFCSFYIFRGKSVQGFMSFDRINKQTEITALYRVSQKKVWLAAPDAKLYLVLCNSRLWCFSIFYGNFYFFATPMAKKNPQTFFYSQNQKFRKKKMCINIISISILLFYKDWITESQKICKIVTRKFAIFSSGIIFRKVL